MTASRIDVEKLPDGQFSVVVFDGAGRSAHRVTLTAEDHLRIGAGKASPEELIRRSFEFLLEREPKESILARFDLPVIGRYFPEYEREIRRRL